MSQIHIISGKININTDVQKIKINKTTLNLDSDSSNKDLNLKIQERLYPESNHQSPLTIALEF